MHYLILITMLFAACTMVSANDEKPGIPPAGENAADALKASPRHGEWVDIALPGSEVKLKTFVVYPERKDKAGVVIIIHEIFGMSDWVRSVADQLASEGYIAIAPDMLSGKGPNGGATDSFTGDAVRDAIRKLTSDEINQRLDAARAYAIAQPSATGKVATIGFCWGGGVSFGYAVHQPALTASIVYYGTPPSVDALPKIAAPVLGCYGEDDARITATVEPTSQAMKAAGKSYDPHIFPKAGHGFLRQQSGKDGANLSASEGAWKETVAFLKKYLQS